MERFAGALFLAFVAGPATWAQDGVQDRIQDTGPPEAPTVEAVAELLRAGGESGLSKLHALGPDAVPAVFAILAGEAPTDPKSGPLLDHDSTELLNRALGAWPAARVERELVAEARARTSLSDRLLALRLLGEIGTAGAVAPLFDLTAGLAPGLAAHPKVTGVLEDALTELLGRERHAIDALYESLPDLGADDRRSVARALGRVGRGEGLTILRSFLGENDELDLLALDALGRLEPRGVGAGGVRTNTSRLLIGYASAEDPKVRRQTAVSLGRLRATDAIDELVRLLDDPDARVRGGALWALEHMTDVDWLATSEEWGRWYSDENAWHGSEWPAIERVLRDGDPSLVASALGEASAHPLYRREVADVVSGLLRHGEEGVVLLACSTLLRLDDAGAVPALVLALGDSRDPVRAAAHATLVDLTGQDLPPSPKAWRSWLDRA